MQTHRSKFLAAFLGKLGVSFGLRLCLLTAIALVFSHPCLAAELNVESQVDQSPIELKNLNDQANVLEKRIKELEQRISTEQTKILEPETNNYVELKLSLSPDMIENDGKKAQNYLISHLRMSLNGRPYIFNQNAVLTTQEFPLPLYLGLIRPGKHLIRIQFQGALHGDLLVNQSALPWQKVDETLTLDVGAEKTPIMERKIVILSRAGRLSIDIN